MTMALRTHRLEGDPAAERKPVLSATPSSETLRSVRGKPTR